MSSSFRVLCLFIVCCCFACASDEPGEYRAIAEDQVEGGLETLVASLRTFDARVRDPQASQADVLALAEELESRILGDPEFEAAEEARQTLRFAVVFCAAEFPDSGPENLAAIESALQGLEAELRRKVATTMPTTETDKP